MIKLVIFITGLIALFCMGFGAPYAIGLISSLVLVIDNGFANFPTHTVAQKIVNSGNSFVLLAIPFFLLAGELMNTGGITRKIFKFCNTLVGWIPGGLGHANVLASIIFAGMSGSAVADAAGLGTIEIHAMEEQGFDTDFSAGITAASSTIGPIIPPSIPMVVFGVSASGVAISKLLIAGIIPGLLTGIALSIMVIFISLKRKYPRSSFPKWSELWSDFKGAFFPLLTPTILIGGMLSGIFTPTEAAVVSVVYAFVLTVIVYREISLRDLYKIIIRVARDSACVLFIIVSSALYGYLLVRAQIPQMLIDIMLGLTTNKYIILLLINVLLIIVGCFMDANAAILILTPALMPMVLEVGIDPVHFGLIMVLNLMIGLLTPPVGMCLYAVSKVAHISLDRVVKGTAPFYLPLIITLLLVTFIPELSTWLPNLLLK